MLKDKSFHENIKEEPDYMSSEKNADIQFVDIISIEQLQSLQDKFSAANGVSSIILDLNNQPVTQASNFNDVCISSFCLGDKCVKTDRIIHNFGLVHPYCRLSEAETPIHIGEKHVANWKIGMCGFGGIVGPFLEAACESVEKFHAIHDKLSDKLKAHFENVCELLRVTAGEISELGYAGMRLLAEKERLDQVVKDRTEEYEAINEELYATNEELYATNEEFAAINEELHNKNYQLEHEITARKEAMQKLEDSESKLHNFIMQSSEGIVIINDEGKVIEWNPEQERITEISREEALGKFSWELYHRVMPAEKADELRDKFRNMVLWHLDPNNKQNYSKESEHVYYLPDKGERYITQTTFQIAVGEKYYLGEILRDTTERKLVDLELELYRTQLEEMVVSQTKELVESKERLTTLSDNLPGGVIYQMSGKPGQSPQFTYISANFVNIFRITVEDAMANSSLFFRLIHPEDGTKLIDLINSPNQLGFVDAECRVNLDTGETKWIYLRWSSHMMENETRVWDGFMVDNTDRKNTERELGETRRQQDILINVLQIVQAAESVDEAINTALMEIGKYAGVSRAYIFEKTADGKAANNAYEWCNEGINPEIDNLQGVPIELMSDWFEAFEKDDYVCVSDIKELSPDAYEQLSLQNIKSLVVLPLESNGVIYGFVGFDECLHYRQWQQKEVELLISLSQIISTTTTRFRAEKSIQLSQQTMRTVLDNVNASIYVSNFDTNEILFANKMIKDKMGEDLEGKICWQILQKDQTAPCAFCPNAKLLDDNKKPTGLYRWEIYNPVVERWFECTDVAIEWIDGRLVHMEYATDITIRRTAEEALRQSEELYRQLTVASPDAIIVCDPQGRVKFLSPKTKELLNISDDVLTDDMTFERYVHPHDLRKALELYQSIVDGNESVRPQLLLMREDGSEFFGEISSATVTGENGKIALVIMVIRDITEQKMNEMELIRAKEKAEESDKLKSAFLANMSHEIRTPINGIIGFLNFLADDDLSPKRRHEYVSVVNNSSIQLVKLIDDIIDIAKIEAKQLSIRPTVFHINDFLAELHTFFDGYLQTNNKEKIALVLDNSQFIDPDALFIDPTRLRQVLTNLIGNAIKFTEKGFIGFGYRPLPPDMLEFWVEDSGIGLPPDQLEVIFERFRQAEMTNSRKYGGTGLGLTISRSLVQMMGGEITVESVKGEGSTFRFTILYLPGSPEDKALLDENESKPPAGDLPLSGMTVLLVEPVVMMYRYYEKLLAPTGITLIRAETVKQWIDAISQPHHIDLVLANARVFKDEYGESLRMVKSVRADLPLALVVPERNEYFNRVINDCRCNTVIDSILDSAKLLNLLKKYM